MRTPGRDQSRSARQTFAPVSSSSTLRPAPGSRSFSRLGALWFTTSRVTSPYDHRARIAVNALALNIASSNQIMSNNSKGKVVVITGASSGLGKATVRLLVAEGATLIIRAGSYLRHDPQPEDVDVNEILFRRTRQEVQVTTRSPSTLPHSNPDHENQN